MDEYIEREALLREIERREALMVGDKLVSVDAMKYFIKNRPAADAEPVRNGQWNADETCPFCGKKSTEGLDAEKWNYWFPEFCHNCGAKMDGDKA